ncbi:hypothetical protein OS188_12150 [Xanthomarina sp. F1114]|uniref:hypothetical protein n=1 Tax=Xanthomarina sp. F1114 TaxID=2996019 RepID=UPI00225E4C5C|nr:hypothetical protein [Xanthomarina sp. F1114]MCX7548705.1 hypothetical protein [Xanthomarina sp. F1114]
MKKVQFAILVYFFGSIISCCSDEGTTTFNTIESASVLLFSFDENGIFPYLDEFNPNELGISVSADSISSKIAYTKPFSTMDKAYACTDPNQTYYTNAIDSLNVVTVYDFDTDYPAGSVINNLLDRVDHYGETSSINIQETESVSHLYKFSKAPENDSLQFKITGRITDQGSFEKYTELVILD